jgi:hypothetical protein
MAQQNQPQQNQPAGRAEALRLRLEELNELRHRGVVATDEELMQLRQRIISRHVEQEEHQHQRPAEALAAVFAAQEERRLFPWRVQKDVAARERASILATDLEASRALYLDLVKAAQVAPEDALVLNHLLWGGDEAARYLVGLLLRKSGSARYLAANMSGGRDDAFWAVHGQTLTRLPLPLFPDIPGFSSINQRMLTEWGGDTSGGGDFVSSVFKFSGHQHGHTHDTAGGEPFLPVYDDGAGGLHADAHDVKDIVDDIYGRLEALTRRQRGGGRGRSRGRGRGRGPSGYTTYRGHRGPYGGEPEETGQFSDRHQQDKSTKQTGHQKQPKGESTSDPAKKLGAGF